MSCKGQRKLPCFYHMISLHAPCSTLLGIAVIAACCIFKWDYLFWITLQHSVNVNQIRWPENEKRILKGMPSTIFGLHWHSFLKQQRLLLLRCQMALTLNYLISKLNIFDFGSECSTPSIGWDDLKMKSFFRHACSHLWPSLTLFSETTTSSVATMPNGFDFTSFNFQIRYFGFWIRV